MTDYRAILLYYDKNNTVTQISHYKGIRKKP